MGYVVFYFDSLYHAESVVGAWDERPTGAVRVPTLFADRRMAEAEARKYRSGRAVPLAQVQPWW